MEDLHRRTMSASDRPEISMTKKESKVSDCSTVISGKMTESLDSSAIWDSTSCFKKNNSIGPVPVLKADKQPKLKPQDISYAQEVLQLENVERRTQALVLKEKQQRKQLKNLKKMYQAKLQEVQCLTEQWSEASQTFKEQISKGKQIEKNLLIQLKTMKQKMSLEEGELLQCRKELKDAMKKKEQMWRKLELLDAHCECKYVRQEEEHGQVCHDSRVAQLVADEQSLSSLKNQIDIIDAQIVALLEDPSAEDQLDIVLSLYRLQRHYHTRIQELLVQKEQKQSEGIIFKLNRIILQHYQAESKMSESVPLSELQFPQSIVCLDINNRMSQSEQASCKQMETVTTLRGTNLAQSRQWEGSLYSPGWQGYSATKTINWTQVKAQVSAVIEAHTLQGYQSLYTSIEDLGVGLLNLSKLNCNLEQFMTFTQKSMEEINDSIRSKAELKYQHIQKLMEVINQKNKCLVAPLV